MKRLLLILILTFSFQSLTKADDIKDFQIEGISVGDSLLDYYSKAEINSKNKILNELKLIFPNSTIDNVKRKHVADPSKKSSTDTTYLYFNNKSGNAGVACYDWSSELVHLDNLKVFIDTSHFLNWLSRAY